MSTRLYLNNAVTTRPGFSERSEVANRITLVSRSYTGETVHEDHGRLYVGLPDSTDDLPEIYKGIVEEVTFEGVVPLAPKRESGEYEFASATAELNHANVFIRGKKLADVRALYRAIRAGTIRPKVSYEAPQTGRPHGELVEEAAELPGVRAELEVTREELKAARKEAASFKLAYEQVLAREAALFERIAAARDVLKKGDGRWWLNMGPEIGSALKVLNVE